MRHLILLLLGSILIEIPAQQVYFSERNDGSIIDGIAKLSGHIPLVLAYDSSSFITTGEIRVSSTSTKFRLIKYSLTGEVVWEKFFGDSGASYSSLNNTLSKWKGNYINTGYYYYQNGPSYALVTSFDDNGDTLFVKGLGDTTGLYTGEALVVEPDNEIAIIGRKQIDSSKINLVLFKLDSNANELWRKEYDFSPNDGAFKIELSHHNGYLISGYRYTGIYYNSYIFQTDSVGNIEWQKTIAKGKNHSLSSCFLKDSSLFIYGHYQTLIGAGYRAYLAMYDPTAQILKWETEIDGYQWATLTDMVENDNGTITLIGNKNYVVNKTSGWLVTINRFGDIVWDRMYSEFTEEHYPFSLIKAPDNGYVFSGYGWDTGQLTQGWVMRVDSNGCESPVCVSPVEEHDEMENTFNVYPNPTLGNLKVNAPYSGNLEVIEVASGKTVHQTTAIPGVNQLNLSDLTPGFYLVRLSGGNKTPLVRKIVVAGY